MSKVFSKLLVLLLVASLLLPTFKINEADAANKNTLGYFEEQLAKYKKEAEDNKNAINKTASEIASTEQRIKDLKAEAISLSKEVSQLNEEIEIHKESIQDKLAESKQILEYMQISSGKNVYLDYVFKADSITDMINRSYVIKEIVDYNTKVIQELEQIINDNKKREEEIEKRKVTISQKEAELEKNVVSLGEKKESLSEGGVGIADQIKIYEAQVKMYKDLGCKSNDIIGVDCAVQGGTTVFRRPTVTGYITQESYYKPSYTHRAVDIGSYNRKKEKIYPIADGTITAIYDDDYGALTVAIEHYNLRDGKYYTSLYVHLSSYAPGLKVGKKITSNQYIGYMGETGKAYGVHLHLEVFPCKLYNHSDPNCYSWAAWDNYGKKLIKNGYNVRNLISFPRGTYNPWYSR